MPAELPIIGRIESIRAFRAFENWTDVESDRQHQFGRQTVIYGHNGAGKSTLGEVFGSIERHQRDPISVRPEAKMTVELQGPDGAKSVTESDHLFPRLLVFNHHYVERNLGMAFRDGDAGEPLLTPLGEKDVDLEAKIEEARASLDAANTAARAARTLALAASRSESAHLEVVKPLTVALLRKFDSNRYNQTRFNVVEAKALLLSDRALLDETSLANAEDRLVQDAALFPNPIDKIDAPNLAPLLTALELMQQYDVTAIAIERLESDPALALWAQRGLALHGAGDPCGFCDQPVTADRIAALNSHFDDSYRRLQNLVERAEEALSKFKRGQADALDKSEALKDGEGIEFSGLKLAAAAFVNGCESFLESCERAIAERQSSPYKAPSVVLAAEPQSGIWAEINDAIGRYNTALGERKANLEDDREAAHLEIRSHIAATHGEEYDRLNVEKGNAASASAEADAALSAAQIALSSLEGQRSDGFDGTELAGKLSNDLAHYLGHAQLRVEFVRAGGRPGFRFLRNGNAATHLSEGERNALALLYFLRSFETEEIKSELNKTCVVIDDPVSSLDQDSMISAFAFLDQALRPKGELGVRQLIVLTHNFDFFRLWKEGLSSALGHDQGDLNSLKKEGKPAVLDLLRASLLELRARAVVDEVGQILREPVLRCVASAHSIKSDYHFLFGFICDSLIESSEDLLPLSGNAMRRVLETFVEFKKPTNAQGKLANAVTALGSAAEVEQALTTQVLKGLNAESHRRTPAINSSYTMASLQEDIKLTLRFMHAIDPAHFHGMIKAVGAPGNVGVEICAGTCNSVGG